MKIRTDFVTNSSSSSFIVFGMELFFENGKSMQWGPFCAYSEMVYGSDYVNGMYADFPDMEVNIELERLDKTKTVEAFSREIYDSITKEYDPLHSLDRVRCFSIEENGLIWEEKEFGDRDNLKKICITAQKGSDYEEQMYIRKYTYDFDTHELTKEEMGEEPYVENDGSGRVCVYGSGGIRHSTDGKSLEGIKKEQQEKEKQTEQERAEKNLSMLQKKCSVIRHIEDFEGKVFVVYGSYGLIIENIYSYITEEKGIIRKKVSGKTDYLICQPQDLTDNQLNDITGIAERGIDLKIITFTDFRKQLPDLPMYDDVFQEPEYENYDDNDD